MSEFDFAKAKGAVERVAAYAAKAETLEDFALAMQADTASPFFAFDPNAHITELMNPIIALLEGAVGVFEDDGGEA